MAVYTYGLNILGLDGDGDLPAEGVVPVIGIDAVIQDVRSRLRLLLGEWFLDPTVGVPYRQRILGKGATEATVRAEIRRAIEASDSISTVDQLDFTLDRTTRHLTVTFHAITTEGESLDSTVGV